MTQAPTPSPLSATDWRVGDFAARLEDHPLVKAGEVHRVTEMFRGGYLGFAPPVGGAWKPRGWGKCDADGWMPWSGGENPVPGQRVQWRTRSEAVRVMSVLSNNLDWTHECRRGFDPIMAFRLAPNAPVEASGSERDVPWLTDDECDEVGKLRFALAMKVYRMSSDLKQNLRPQPSGETREIAKTFSRDAIRDLAEQVDLSGPHAGMIAIPLWVAKDILALLSARPLALGGRHSSGEDAAWSWLNRHVECDPADRDYSADEMVDAFMAGAGRYDIWLKALERIAGEQQHRSGYCQTDITVEPALTAEEAQTVARAALSTTPARAEAQDEGAAVTDAVSHHAKNDADPVVSMLRDVAERLDRPEPDLLGARVGVQAVRLAVSSRLLAHPSPTPAADADRVREERDLLARQLASLTSPDIDHKGAKMRLMTMRRAALKSTAAKEGGE